MPDIIINIPFDRARFEKCQSVLWWFFFKKGLKKNIFYTALAILCLTISFFVSDPVGMALSGGYLFYLALMWSGIVERRIKFFSQIKKYAERYEQAQMDCTYIFTDDALEYMDKEKHIKLNWHLFEPVIVYQDYLIFITTAGAAVNYIISEEGMGTENYKKLLDLFNRGDE